MVGTYHWEHVAARQRRRGHAAHGAGAPMRVLALDRMGGTLARCAGVDGVPVTVETALIAPLEPGAIVLVQAGVALARLDAEWAP
ncbi:MAG TPA: HypC/HybG/HupF family hydrogenase formation chaperone [Conexibacter sp.]|nr:HypC/HybG/HupF family hydrogenase formation chaperone [Conexibacter sp.]